MTDGYVLLWRKITECPVLAGEKYDRFHAWVDLILSANENGDVTFTYRGLAERWGWSTETVHRFIRKLNDEGMLGGVPQTQNQTLSQTHQTLVKYGFYQGGRDANPNAFPNTEKKKKSERKDGKESESKEKGRKESLKEKVECGTPDNASAHAHEEKPVPKRNVIPPSVEDVRIYCEERKNGIDPEEFWDFYQSKGWLVGKVRMKDWQACVRTWEQQRKKEKPRGTTVKVNKFNTGVIEGGTDFGELAKRFDVLGGM